MTSNPTVRTPRYCYQLSSRVSFADWYTYTINWTPNLLGSTDRNIPVNSMHWVLQFGTKGTPDVTTQGHVLIDWATTCDYSPSTQSRVGLFGGSSAMCSHFGPVSAASH